MYCFCGHKLQTSAVIGPPPKMILRSRPKCKIPGSIDKRCSLLQSSSYESSLLHSAVGKKKMAGGVGELKLLGLWASPFVLRAKLALSFKGLRYEYVEEDLYRKSDRLLGYNPVHKKVPVLVHDGRPVCESRVIVEYLDDAFPGRPSLLPADPYDRAVARFWAAFIDDKLMASWIQSVRGKTAAEKAEGLARAMDAVATLEAELAGRPFFGEEGVGFVDVVLGAAAGWAPASERLYGTRLFDAARSPHLHAWLRRFVALEEVREVVPDVDALVEYGKMRDAEIAAGGK
jgi:glutathione S-transferase